MQFRVPQFIDIEDKIFGPLTFKQFAYLVGGIGLGFVIFRIIPYGPLAFVLAAPPVIFGLMLAFYKVNNKPFVFVLEASIRYFFGNKLYLWQKTEPPAPPTDKERREEAPVEQVLPKVSDSKLKELSWGLDVLDKKQ